MSRIIIFDTETNSAKEGEIIEAAWLEISTNLTTTPIIKNIGNLDVLGMFEQRYKPKKPSSLGALLTHGILDEELNDCPPSSDFKLPEDVEYLIGHKIDFDWAVAGEPKVKRICTLAMARYVWENLDCHKLGALIYHLYGKTKETRDILSKSHSALFDCRMAAFVVDAIMKEKNIDNFEDLYLFSEKCRLPRIMPFGKHVNESIESLPSKYLAWVIEQTGMDEYLVEACKLALRKK